MNTPTYHVLIYAHGDEWPSVYWIPSELLNHNQINYLREHNLSTSANIFPFAAATIFNLLQSHSIKKEQNFMKGSRQIEDVYVHRVVA